MKIKISNDGINQELYSKYESLILEITRYFSCDLDLNVNITVKVTKENSKFNGSCVRKRKGYVVQLSERLLHDIEDGYGNDHLQIVIMHELIHVKDACNINMKKSSYKTHRRFYRTYDNFIINIGYSSWTEMHACLVTFVNSNAYKREPTFLQMVKKLDEILEFRDKILKYTGDDEEYFNNMLDDYLELINLFVYLSSRYIAAIPFKNTNYTHCDKTQKKSSYIYLKKLYDKLSTLFGKSLHGIYGKHLLSRTYKMGLFWMKEIYVPLNIYLSKLNGNVLFEFVQ